jgi:adenosine deaminase
MVTHSLITHFLADRDSLLQYQKGEIPAFNDVKRRMLLLERGENNCIPDHYYRMNQEKSFDGIYSLSDSLRIGLYRIADKHLELRKNRIFVKQSKMNQWQELLTYIPPLVLQMAFLNIAKPLTCSTDVTDYFHTFILPNTKYTALPYTYVPQIESYVATHKGFHDLHIHLNGSTETDRAWQDMLFVPDKAYKSLMSACKNPKVKEQLEQVFGVNTPSDYHNMLKQASNIRHYLFSMLYPKSGNPKMNEAVSIEQVLYQTINAQHSVYNPFTSLVSNNERNSNYPLSTEGLMYVLVFHYLTKEPRDCVASLFHYYLLILGLANRLLVQQKHQYGFEQFQKITLNNLRDTSEREYLNRFYQLQGNEQRNIRFVEGRFAPKKTRNENISLIQRIEKAWEKMLENIRNEFELKDEQLPQLRLIAHFIKQPDSKPDKHIRHKYLRYEVWQKAKALVLLKQNHPRWVEKLVGIDAAASEFDALPEVFAPAFRYMKRHGFKHFTYHAGEDFFHIISGLRAIYEAVEFNNLGNGDRIGHATAAGISPEIWHNKIGKTLFMKQGDYLDDLIFVYHLIIVYENQLLINKIPLLVHKIQELAYSVYHKPYTVKTLENAWLLRRFNPVLLFAVSRDSVALDRTFDDDEWCDIFNNTTQHKALNERINLMQLYHNQENNKSCFNKIVEVKVDELFSDAELETLQLEVLHFLHKKEIVIETLPTSNVRIGHYSNYDTYHLHKWLQWAKVGKPIPPIVVGTDDAGIFATNIFNEYANIYCNLVSQMTGHCEAMEIIERLDKNGKIYKFEI